MVTSQPTAGTDFHPHHCVAPLVGRGQLLGKMGTSSRVRSLKHGMLLAMTFFLNHSSALAAVTPRLPPAFLPFPFSCSSPLFGLEYWCLWDIRAFIPLCTHPYFGCLWIQSPPLDSVYTTDPQPQVFLLAPPELLDSPVRRRIISTCISTRLWGGGGDSDEHLRSAVYKYQTLSQHCGGCRVALPT